MRLRLFWLLIINLSHIIHNVLYTKEMVGAIRDIVIIAIIGSSLPITRFCLNFRQALIMRLSMVRLKTLMMKSTSSCPMDGTILDFQLCVGWMMLKRVQVTNFLI